MTSKYKESRDYQSFISVKLVEHRNYEFFVKLRKEDIAAVAVAFANLLFLSNKTDTHEHNLQQKQEACNSVDYQG